MALLAGLFLGIGPVPPGHANGKLSGASIEGMAAGWAVSRLDPHSTNDAAPAVALGPVNCHRFTEGQDRKVLPGTLTEGLLTLRRIDAAKIGRASCRERV